MPSDPPTGKPRSVSELSRSHSGTISGEKSGSSGQSKDGNSSQLKPYMSVAGTWRRWERDDDEGAMPSSIGFVRGVEGWVAGNFRLNDLSMSRRVRAYLATA